MDTQTHTQPHPHTPSDIMNVVEHDEEEEQEETVLFQIPEHLQGQLGASCYYSLLVSSLSLSLVLIILIITHDPILSPDPILSCGRSLCG